MIEPAQNHRHELNRLYNKTFYDSKYMYYRGCWGTKEYEKRIKKTSI